MAGELDDRGLTLVDLVVAMTVMAIVGAMFTGSVLQMYAVLNRTSAAADAQSQVNAAFLRLDTQIRYAAGITVPGAGADAGQYVEYHVDNTATSTCGQLWFNPAGYALEWRSWRQGDQPGTWTVLATQVSTATFTLAEPGSGAAYQTLTVSLTAGTGPDTRTLHGTFAALNTNPSTGSVTGCGAGRTAA